MADDQVIMIEGCAYKEIRDIHQDFLRQDHRPGAWMPSYAAFGKSARSTDLWYRLLHQEQRILVFSTKGDIRNRQRHEGLLSAADFQKLMYLPIQKDYTLFPCDAIEELFAVLVEKHKVPCVFDWGALEELRREVAILHASVEEALEDLRVIKAWRHQVLQLYEEGSFFRGVCLASHQSPALDEASE